MALFRCPGLRSLQRKSSPVGSADINATGQNGLTAMHIAAQDKFKIANEIQSKSNSSIVTPAC